MMQRSRIQIARTQRMIRAKAVGYMKPDIDPNTRLYVPFNEGVGEVAKDYSQYGNHAQLTDVEWGIGINGNAGVFNGVSSYGDCGNDASLDITDAITIKAWAIPDVAQTPAGWYGIAGWTNAYLRGGLKIHNTRLYWDAWCRDPLKQCGVKEGPVITEGIWQHVAGTYIADTGKLWLYLNGLGTEFTITGTVSEDAGNVNIGRLLSWDFNGTIAPVIIKALTESAAQSAANCYEVCN